MEYHFLERHFDKIGARLKINPERRRRRRTGEVTIDIGQDKLGEFFDIAIEKTFQGEVQVVDIQPKIQHLLLMSRQDRAKHKFLCGHDERHWFVAAVPERAAVSNVREAFKALKPDVVRLREDRLNVKARKRNRRRNEAFVRQGEWFFVPVPTQTKVDERMIFRNEPISRGGKPHICEQLVRRGGETVYVSRNAPQGITASEYRQLLNRQPKLRNENWTVQQRNPQVFVRGKVRHPDHKTIILNVWHEVLMNTETQAAAMKNVAFID